MARVGGVHVPEDARAVRGVGVTATAPTASRTRPTTSSSAWSTRRGASRSTRPPTTTTTSSSSGTLNEATGPVHAEHRRPESRSAAASATTSATSGWSRRCSAMPPPASRRRTLRGARAPAGRRVPLYMRFDPTGHAMSQPAALARVPSVRGRRASGSSTWCRARRCSRSTTARRRCSIRCASGPRHVDELTRELLGDASTPAEVARHDRRAAARARARRDRRQAGRRCRRSSR